MRDAVWSVVVVAGRDKSSKSLLLIFYSELRDQKMWDFEDLSHPTMRGVSLTTLTFAELFGRLNSKELSSVDVTTACLETIRRRDPSINAFLFVDHDDAIKQAEEVDRKRAAGEPIGLLAGVPVAIKDVLCTKGQPTTCGSRMLKNYVPPYDAQAITKLRQADAILIGKTNMDEFAMGSSG